MKNIWLPDSETKVVIDVDGNIRIWDEIIMTREPLAKKSTGFTAQLPKENILGSSNGRISGSGPDD